MQPLPVTAAATAVTGLRTVATMPELRHGVLAVVAAV
jgi:hypothetical protein